MIGLPYVAVPTWRADIPLIGEHLFTIFGVTATVAVVVGFRLMMRRAKQLGLDVGATDKLGVRVVIGGFAMAHWVSVLFYYPEHVQEDPWVLLRFWGGMSSVGGFIGGTLTFAVVTRLRRLPTLAHADALAYGLLAGFTIGRIGCALVHDHPGAVSTSVLAVGPWPDGAYRWDLGLVEVCGLAVLCAFVYGWVVRRKAPPGRLTAVIAVAYGLGRFPLDFLRAEDDRYAGLTTAQYACIAFVLAGVWLWHRVSIRSVSTTQIGKPCSS